MVARNVRPRRRYCNYYLRFEKKNHRTKYVYVLVVKCSFFRNGGSTLLPPFEVHSFERTENVKKESGSFSKEDVASSCIFIIDLVPYCP